MFRNLELQETGSRLQESESKLAKEQERSKALEAQLQRAQSEKDAAVGIQQSQQQTISLLVSEKASLTSDLELLSEVQQSIRAFCPIVGILSHHALHRCSRVRCSASRGKD